MIASILRWWGPLVLYMALVFFVSSRPRPTALDETPDFVLHAAAYFVMSVLAVRATARGVLEPASAAELWGGVAIAVLFGASDEWHQMRVPERVGSGIDLLYDGIGALLGGAALSLFWKARVRQVGSKR